MKSFFLNCLNQLIRYPGNDIVCMYWQLCYIEMMKKRYVYVYEISTWTLNLDMCGRCGEARLQSADCGFVFLPGIVWSSGDSLSVLSPLRSVCPVWQMKSLTQALQINFSIWRVVLWIIPTGFSGTYPWPCSYFGEPGLFWLEYKHSLWNTIGNSLRPMTKWSCS